MGGYVQSVAARPVPSSRKTTIQNDNALVPWCHAFRSNITAGTIACDCGGARCSHKHAQRDTHRVGVLQQVHLCTAAETSSQRFADFSAALQGHARHVVVFKNTSGVGRGRVLPLQADVNLVTALVPSDTACFVSSPGRMRRTAVWISRLVTVGFLL